MTNVMVDSRTLQDFSKNIITERDKLNEILEKMKKASVLYQDMVDTKTGNLYKEVMLRELIKEQNKLNIRCNLISKEFNDYATLFMIASEKIKESVSKNGEIL